MLCYVMQGVQQINQNIGGGCKITVKLFFKEDCFSPVKQQQQQPQPIQPIICKSTSGFVCVWTVTIVHNIFTRFTLGLTCIRVIDGFRLIANTSDGAQGHPNMVINTLKTRSSTGYFASVVCVHLCVCVV